MVSAQHSTSANRPLDALIHLTPFVPVAVAVALAGHTDLWLAVVLPLGPVLLGLPLAGSRSIGRSHLISALELSSSVALGALATYGCIWLGLNVDGLALLIPLGVLLTLGLAANMFFLSVAGAVRALKAIVVEHPWVIPLRRYLPELPETGFGVRR